MTWGTPVQSFVFLGLLVFELEPMYATSDRQTDADDRLMPPLTGRGHNKCIEDDTKAATRQSPNCIKKTKIIKYSKKDFQYGGWNSYTLQFGTIMTLISPGDCTLQCRMWL